MLLFLDTEYTGIGQPAPGLISQYDSARQRLAWRAKSDAG